jgi:hypothetical protein
MAEMSPLRRRMIEDMTVRNLSPATQRSCVHAVAEFGRFLGRSPDKLDLEECERSRCIWLLPRSQPFNALTLLHDTITSSSRR